MYNKNNLIKREDGIYELKFNKEKIRIMQLTDIHFGFGWLSKKEDALAKKAITNLFERAMPDLIVVTGDMIFPFVLRCGTMDNGMQMREFMRFMDHFHVPYLSVIGNHDTEVGSKLNREELGDVLSEGEYSLFDKGSNDIFGVGNYIVNLVNNDKYEYSLVMLDSNMYAKRSFFGGFDCIHKDQIDWTISSLNKVEGFYDDVRALAFFHMPLPEYKEAYSKCKMGDKNVIYNFGNVGEANEYFGISYYNYGFFDRALEYGKIKGMFCGHDHLNTISMKYKGIDLSYGMSIDYLGYAGIKKRYTQRGSTLIDIKDTSYRIHPLCYEAIVSRRVRGYSKDFD